MKIVRILGRLFKNPLWRGRFAESTTIPKGFTTFGRKIADRHVWAITIGNLIQTQDLLS